jgi:arginyl-tRNA synthetase
MNLIDEVRAALRSSGLEDGFPIVALRDAGESDLAVIVGKSANVREGAARVAEVLRDQAAISKAKRTGPRLLLRFDDDFIAELGGRLEAGDESALATEDLLAGRRAVVQFCNPNATKALHVGHLRNLAVGQSFACALEAAGAAVERQCEISDTGQQVGEAMAGYLRYAGDSTPQSAGKKSDRFVGEWYAQYVKENSVVPEDVSEHDMAVARELVKSDGLAGSLLDRWAAGDEEVTALWAQLREWALAGQAETLGRLGIGFDRPVFTSDHLPWLDSFVEAGLAGGTFRHADDGVLVYQTGREEYPRFPLARPDGASTMNLRSLAIWHELMPELTDATYVHVCGLEWQECVSCINEILKKLRPEVSLEPKCDVLHGMVSTEDGVASSSAGSDALIDDLLDDLAASPEIGELTIEGRPGSEAEDLAAIVALAFSQDRPLAKPLVATHATMLDRNASTGMLLARAWRKAADPAADGPPSPSPDDPVYRFAVIQSQVYRQLLQLGLQQVDLLDLIRFLARFSEWYLGQPDDPSTARVMRCTLAKGLGSLGLLPADRLGAERSAVRAGARIAA